MGKKLLSITILVGLVFSIISADAQHLGIFNSMNKIQKNNTEKKRNLQMQTTFNRSGGFYPDSVLNYSWDTISKSWDTSNIVIYTYNSNQQVTSMLTKLYNSHIFINSRKQVNTFNSNGNILQILITDWISNSWQNDSLIITHYNSFGNTIFQVSEYWMGNNWLIAEADSSNFVWSGGKLIEKIDYSYDNNYLMYIPTQLLQLNYLGSSRTPYEGVISQWDGTNFDSVYKYTNVQWKLGYDSVAFSSPSDYTVLELDSSNNWTNYMKQGSTVSGILPLTDTSYQWMINSWMAYNIDKYTYNTNQQITQFLDIQIQGSTIDTSELDIFDYDSKGNMTLNTYWTYDYMANQVLQYYGQKYIYTYYNTTSTILSMITQQYDFNSMQYYNFNKAVYLPQGTATNINTAISDLSVQLYPNPVTDNLNIRIQGNQYKAIIYNIDGKMITQINLHNEVNEINTGNMPQGIYILKLFNDNNTIIKRFIKQ